MTFKFNAIQGELDLVNPPDGSNYQFQYYDDGEFAGAPIVEYDPVNERLNVGDQTGVYAFFATPEQKLSCSNQITSICGDDFPAYFDIIKILSAFSARIDPRADTAGTFGVTLYAASGASISTIGTKTWTGLPIGATPFGMSVIGAFGTANVLNTGGSMAGIVGALYSATHGGYGGYVDSIVGGMFDAVTEDTAAAGTPTGTAVSLYGGTFSSGGSGIDIGTCISGVFYEPYLYDAGTGAGVPTATNKTAAYIAGSYSLKEQAVPTAASITGLVVNASNLVFTGSTATSLHGIAADSLPKVLELYNPSSAAVTLKHQSGTEGTAANRLLSPTGADVVIAAGYTARLIYNTTALRWIIRV